MCGACGQVCGEGVYTTGGEVETYATTTMGFNSFNYFVDVLIPSLVFLR